MRRADAPPAGWYPDPTGRTRLRWWDGGDWAEHWRAPPPHREPVEVDTGPGQAASSPRTFGADHAPSSEQVRERTARRRDDTAELMAEVRQAARDEVDRAVERLSHQARDATRRLEPLINQYGDRVLRGLRIAGIVAIGLVVLWLVLQAFTQASLMDWLGERIDNLTAGWSPAAVPAAPATTPG